MKKNIANIITFSRLIGGLILIFLETLSLPFYIVYTWCCLSDCLDGFAARKLHITSNLGSKLDTISDLLLNTVMILKLKPILDELLSFKTWCLIYGVVCIRVLLYLYVFWKYKKLLSRHTILNKTTAVLLAFLPYTIRWKYFFMHAYLIILIAYVSVVEEIHYIIKYHY